MSREKPQCRKLRETMQKMRQSQTSPIDLPKTIQTNFHCFRGTGREGYRSHVNHNIYNYVRKLKPETSTCLADRHSKSLQIKIKRNRPKSVFCLTTAVNILTLPMAYALHFS